MKLQSVSTRLVLAFALTSLAGIVLAAIFVRQFVVQEFDAFLLQQRQEEFVTQLTRHYEQTGSWENVRNVLRSVPHNGPGGEPEPLIAFALADATGRIVLSPNPLLRGQIAEPARLAEGIAIIVDGRHVGTMMLLDPPSRNPDEVRYLERTDRALALAAAGALLVALALGLLLARLITRPLRDLSSATQALAAGDLGRQVPVRSQDELGLLAQQFNAMSTDLQRNIELRRRMSADIAHDLRTPLTVISGYLEAMRDEELAPTPARFAAMHDETRTLLRLVDDLHTLSLADAGELPLKCRPLEPIRLLERVAQTYQDSAAQAGVQLSIAAPANLPALYADEDQLVRALANLVHNALRHSSAGGKVTLAAQAAAQAVILEVRDTGAGIPPEHLPHIFERFYRADESRQQASGGSGLGLAIVRSIVEAHGGHVRVESTVGHGTCFALLLPLSK